MSFWEGFEKKAALVTETLREFIPQTLPPAPAQEEMAESQGMEEEVEQEKQASPFLAGFLKQAQKISDQLTKLLKWNDLGGIDPRGPQEMAQAQAVNLVTLPTTIKGANCATCQFSRKFDEKKGIFFCTNPDVNQEVSERMLCSQWSHFGARKPWEEIDPYMVQNQEAIDPATGESLDPAMAQGQEGVEPGMSPNQAQPPGQEEAESQEEQIQEKPQESPKKKPSSQKQETGGKHTININVGGKDKK